jgi:hypothetical protein
MPSEISIDLPKTVKVKCHPKTLKPIFIINKLIDEKIIKITASLEKINI